MRSNNINSVSFRGKCVRDDKNHNYVNMKKFTITIFITLFAISLFAQIQNPRDVVYVWNTDTTKKTIDLSEMILVAEKGLFPIIDYPAFVGKSEGKKIFFEHEPVISVEINGRAKAYPLNMLTFHEMANDTLSGEPILPTYCPLCNSGIVYNRRLNYENKEYLLEFEVSGFLRNSDMVMFDRQTETWWQQLMGDAIVGELAGAELDIVPSLIISVKEFFERYPDGKILSKETGHEKAMERYGSNPYNHYDSISKNPYSRFFDEENVDSRLPAMERIVDIQDEGKYKIYPFTTIAKEGVINDQFESKHVVVFYQSGTVSNMDEKDITQSKDVGSVTIFSPYIKNELLTFLKNGDVFIDDQTNSQWDITGKCLKGKLKGKQLMIEPHSNHFAFAWLAFYPETVIYGQE